jgi:catechol 2,3-dioxygenase-like lactoylglutathione lyase family enzyme
MPLDHVNIPVADLATSKAFYTAALAPFGYSLVYESESALGFGAGDGGEEDEPFAVRLGKAPNVPSHVAFSATGATQVDAFHVAALAAGGRDNGAPGVRPYGEQYYAAFVLDPDGHNIEAVFHGPTGET